MSKIKKLLIICSILLILLIIIILILNKIEEKKEMEAPEEAYYFIEDEEEYDYKLTFKDYLIIKNCLQIYVDTLNIDSSSYYGRDENDNFTKVVSESEIKTNIYNLIDKSYLQKNDILEDNIYQYVDTYNENKLVIPIEIIEKAREESTIMTYGVVAILTSTTNMENIKEIYLVINIDKSNKTFSVVPVKTLQELNSYNYNKKIENIANKENNRYYEEEITNQKIATEYFSNFKNVILSSTELAYSYLDEEYKQKRFPTKESFDNYFEKNKEMLKIIRIEKYEAIDSNGVTQYVCVDQFNNTYIFNEKETMKYNIILDLYTTDLPQFIEKYDSVNEQEKVMMNIEKIRLALNSGDYSYVYNKLVDAFKQNKFPTQEEFEIYMQNNLYSIISIDYIDFINEGETYIYNVQVGNLIDKNATKINMQIIMQLLENRDFVMSFNIG